MCVYVYDHVLNLVFVHGNYINVSFVSLLMGAGCRQCTLGVCAGVRKKAIGSRVDKRVGNGGM